jgi:glycosyltransferase involved in cell wall biosynthesis
LRVLHAPFTIAGHVTALSEAERRLGIDSKTLALYPDRFGFEADVTFAKSAARSEFARPKLIKTILNNADVVHFNFGTSATVQKSATQGRYSVEALAKWLYLNTLGLIELSDLRLYRKAGIKIVVSFQGDDARCLTRAENPLLFDEAGYYSEKSNRVKSNRLRKWETFADHIFILNPDLVTYFNRKVSFLPYSIKSSFPSLDQHPLKFDEERPLRIVHAPSHDGVKGTRFVIDAIENLKASGLSIDLKLVRNLSNSELLTEIRNSDLLIDQLLIGWYGGVAVEAMNMGVPVISFVNTESCAVIPELMNSTIPILNSSPKALERTIMDFYRSGLEVRKSISNSSVSFATKWHDPLRVASSTVETYSEITKPGV